MKKNNAFFQVSLLIGMMLTASAWGGAIGNPTLANNWDTTSAVSVRASMPGYSDRGWINTINGVGITGAAGDIHIFSPAAHYVMAVSPGSVNPRGGTINDGVYGDRWIEYSFDQTYALDRLDIWNFNEIAGAPTPTDPCSWWNWAAMGLRDVVVQVSQTGGAFSGEWTTVGEFTIDNIPNVDGIPVSTSIDMGDIEARFVVVTLKNGDDGTWLVEKTGLDNRDFGLSEVRFYGEPVAAPAIGNPTAANGWDTTSAVSVATSAGAGYSGREFINTINGAGLDAATGLMHGKVNWSEMGVGSGAANPRGGTINGTAGDGDPNTFGDRWIEYSFDQVYSLDAMDIWAYNENADWSWSAFSIKDVYIEVSTTGGTDPTEWTPVAKAAFAAAPAETVPATTHFDFGGPFGSIAAKYVVISLKNGNEGTYINNLGLSNPDFGLSEVRFYGVPRPGLSACGEEGTVYLDSDANLDCYVNLLDFALITNAWNQCTDPENSTCDEFWSWQ